jgi:beta-lactamase regulating signal transducer with metallopeptidase domain
MGFLIENLDWWARLLLQALLNTLWQGLVIVALAWLLLRLLKRASATTRHAVWLVSLVTIGALPFIALVTQREQAKSVLTAPPTFVAPRVEETISVTASDLPRFSKVERATPPRATGAQSSFSINTEFVSAAAINNVEMTPVAAPRSAAPVTKRRSITSIVFTGIIPTLLVGVWLLGCALMLLRVARSYHALFRLRRQLGFVPSAQRTQTQRLAEIFGISRRVRVFTSHRIAMPMTIGALRPLVILPPDFASHLAPTEFESVIAHELAHIKRWDYLTNLLQRLVQAFLFFHPAIWFINRQLLIERELACDDWAVKMCEPRRYASCLTRLVELLGESSSVRLAAAGILFGKHVISRRVEMILNRERNTTTAVSKPALIYAISLALLFVAVCSLIAPVIAVPLGQTPAAKPQPKKETKAAPAAPARAQEAPPLPPLPPEPSEAVIALPDDPDFPEPPDAPLAPAIAALTPEAEFAPLAPEALIVGVAGEVQGGFSAPAAPTPLIEFYGQAPTPRPAVAPMATTIAEWGQDNKTRTPTIPENELLNVLTEIVKRDADPNVRNEALQGIYRLRSDAAVNTLIQLYDGTSDPKVKSEIIGYLLRREGDNSKAIAKLTTIAKSEQKEELRNRAVRYLGSVKGDDGANNLIQIYDGIQDAKTKQYVIRSLASNKSRKAIDKLIQIAKNDTDPAVRQSAIRALYGIDNRLYMELVDRPGARIGMLSPDFKFDAPRLFDMDAKGFQFDTKRWEEMSKEWQEKHRELLDKLHIEGLDKLKIEDLHHRLRLELPQIELRLKDLERMRFNFDRGQLDDLEGQLRLRRSLVENQLAYLQAQHTATHPQVLASRNLLNSLNQELSRLAMLRGRTPRAAPVQRAQAVAPRPASAF